VRRELALIHDERMRMSHEIHDTLMQGLYSVALQLDAITPLIGEPASPVHARIQRVRRRIEEHIAEAREAILLLRSTRSEKRNIVEALRDAGERLAAGKIPLVFAVDGTPRPCPSKVTTHALRIGQEAILNAVRHSEARRLDVEVRFEDRLLRVRVADDGRGLDAAPTRCNGRTAHYGLMTMKERAASAGGRCTITSAPGSGVEVVAEFPLAPTG
jgi:signal transduction histidine kinase